MTKEQLAELYYITPITNLESILTHGLLSHRRASGIRHVSIAMSEIQDRRKGKLVPGGHHLHDYVNLYVCARNPMLYKRQGEHRDLCVLRVSTAVLDLDGVVIADQNAASDYVRFGRAPDALANLDYERVFAEYWTHPDDQTEQLRHKSAKCAEVLVPDRVDPGLILGAYVSCAHAQEVLLNHAPNLSVVIDLHLFFQRGSP